MNIKLSSGCCLLLFLLSDCAPSRLVRPLKVDEQMIGLTVGGPLFEYSKTTFPMPLSSVFYARGFTEKTSGFASLHITSLFYGIFQTDIGLCREVYHNDRMRLGVTTTPVLNFAIDRWEKHLKLWPQLDVNAYWEIKPKESFLYAGVCNWFELSAFKEGNNDDQLRHWLINPHLGFQYNRNRWAFIIETKFLAPHADTTPNVVEYTGIQGKGALGIYFGINRFLK